MTYNEFIQNIINTRGQWNIDDNEYYEIHHIVPRCMNGNDDKDNLIRLYAKEHFIAHKLLAEENPNNHSLWSAYFLMCNFISDNQERYTATPEEYEECRKKYSELNKGRHFFNNGIISIRCLDEEKPEGFVSGRLPYNYSFKESRKGTHFCKDKEFTKGNEPWNKNKKMSDEYCKKMSEVKTGVPNIKKRIDIIIIDTLLNTQEVIKGINVTADKLGMNRTHAREYINTNKLYKNRYMLMEVTNNGNIYTR